MPSPIPLTPLASLKISTHLIPSHAFLPNTTPHSHPLIIYHAAYPPSTPPSAIETLLTKNSITPQWRYTMYTTTHYHSTTHEVLCVVAGRAKLLFGGEKNPGKVETEVKAGDAMLVPAGVAHRLLEDVDGGFEMVGGYPVGCGWDMCYGKSGEEDKMKAVANVEWLEKDPIYGEDGPALWSNEKVKEKSEL